VDHIGGGRWPIGSADGGDVVAGRAVAAPVAIRVVAGACHLGAGGRDPGGGILRSARIKGKQGAVLHAVNCQAADEAATHRASVCLHLAAACQSPQPGAAVDRDPPVVVGGFLVSLAGMDRHPNSDREPTWPGLRVEGLLNRAGCRDCITGSGKNREEAVSLPTLLEHGPALVLDAGGQELIVAVGGQLHGGGVLLPVAGGRLDVRQEERNRPPRQVCDSAYPVDRGAHGRFIIRRSHEAVEP